MTKPAPGSKEYETPEGTTLLQGKVADTNESALTKCRDLGVGRRGYGPLLKFDLIRAYVTPLPGALGFLLRRLLYRRLLRHMGKNVVIGRSVTIRHPHTISIGDGALIDDYAVLDAKGESNDGIRIGRNVMIGRNTVLSCKDGDLSIGDNSSIAMNCIIRSGLTVRVGENVLMAANCYVIGGGTHEAGRTDMPIIRQGQAIGGIAIGDNAWIGAGVTVMDGVSIGRDVIVGAGAVVTRDMPDSAIAKGAPARATADRRARPGGGYPSRHAAGSG